MKASELIRELKVRIDPHGDLEVVLWDLAAAEYSQKSKLVDVTADLTTNPGCIEIVFE